MVTEQHRDAPGASLLPVSRDEMSVAMTDTGRNGRGMLTLADLERLRLKEIAQIKRLEAQLGKAFVRGRRARRGGLVARNLEKREGMKLELARHTDRLSLLNAAIKSGRRAANLMLLNGMPHPRNERELMATLYRILIDILPPVEQNDYQRTILRAARDYVTTGIVR